MKDDMGQSLAIKIGSGAFVSAVAVSIPELAVPMAAARPAIEAVLTSFFGRSTNSVDHVVKVAAETSKLDANGFISRMDSSPELTVAFVDAVQEATRTISKEKLHALGRVLGNMATDEAQIDPGLVWIDILKQVDRPHLRVLQTALESERWRPDVMHQRSIGERTGLGAAALSILSTLTGLGLLTDDAKEGPLAEEFYELLGVEMPPKKPEIRDHPDDESMSLEVSTPGLLKFRAGQGVRLNRGQTWVTIWNDSGKSGDHEVVFDGNNEAEASFGTRQAQIRLVWFEDSVRHETTWKLSSDGSWRIDPIQ